MDDAGEEVWEQRRRSESRCIEPLNNNSENRVASITFNDLFAAAHHLGVLLIPLPLHFRPVICSSVSVICAFAQWESRRKDRLWNGGGAGEQILSSAEKLAG